jgi:ketosteroid isomerase-like protein
MKKTQIISILFVGCVSCLAINIARADQAADEAAIRKNDAAYVEAYNKNDAKAVAALWSPEAVYVDPETGEESVGRDQIEK